MFIERTHTTQIEIKDPEILYSVDLKDALKKCLTARYVDKCFKKSYVLEIQEILRHSPPICERERVGGTARVAVTFKFRSIIYDRFEVIPDAKIVQIMEDGRIICRSKYAAIMLMANPKLQHFKVNQMIPVRAVNSKYIPARPVISVQGIPFVPLKNEPEREYEINITDEDQRSLEPMYQRFAEEQKRFETLCGSKAAVTAWSNLLNPSKGFKPPSGFQSTPLGKIRNSGRIARSEWTDLDDMTASFKPEKSDQIIKNSVQVLRGYLNSSIKQLQMASSLAELYDVKGGDPWIELYKKEKSS